MSENGTLGFSWEFIDEIAWWALGLGSAAAVIGAFVLGDPTFAYGCLAAVVVDVVLVRVASRRARDGLAEGRIDSSASIIMVPGRLGAKGILLVLSLTLPWALSFAGTVVGVLAFDLTLAFVGSVKAASRMIRHSRQGG